MKGIKKHGRRTGGHIIPLPCPSKAHYILKGYPAGLECQLPTALTPHRHSSLFPLWLPFPKDPKAFLGFLPKRVFVLSHFSCVRLFGTLWTIAHQAPPSMGFSRQEYLSGLPLPSPTAQHSTNTYKKEFLFFSRCLVISQV